MFASKEVHVAIERWGWGFNNIIKSSLTYNCKFSFIFETISISILLQNAAHPQIMHNMSKLLLEMCMYVCKPETTRVLLIVCPYKPVLMIRKFCMSILPPTPHLIGYMYVNPTIKQNILFILETAELHQITRKGTQSYSGTVLYKSETSKARIGIRPFWQRMTSHQPKMADTELNVDSLIQRLLEGMRL